MFTVRPFTLPPSRPRLCFSPRRFLPRSLCTCIARPRLCMQLHHRMYRVVQEYYVRLLIIYGPICLECRPMSFSPVPPPENTGLRYSCSNAIKNFSGVGNYCVHGTLTRSILRWSLVTPKAVLWYNLYITL